MNSRRSDIIFFFALAVVAYAAFHVREVLMLIYTSMIFAIVLGPAVERIEKVRIGNWSPNRGMAIVLLLVGVFAAVTLFLLVALPPVFRDARAVAEDWPQKVAWFNDKIKRVPFLADYEATNLVRYTGAALGGAFGLVKGVAGGFMGFFSGLILMVYFVIDGDRAFRFITSMFRSPERERLEQTMIRADNKARKWLVGQLMLMIVLGVLATITYTAMGLRYSYALGVLTGLANIIPIIGPIASVLLACIVALVESPIKVLGVLGFYFIYQQLENAFLSPRIMKNTVNLSPLAVVISLAIGGTLAGILGALMAVPTAAIISVFAEEYLVKKPAIAAAPEA